MERQTTSIIYLPTYSSVFLRNKKKLNKKKSPIFFSKFKYTSRMEPM